MINLPSKDDLDKLESFHDSICLTIYASSIGSPESNRIQLKNLLHDAERKLLKSGIKTSDIDNILKPTKKAMDDKDFWSKYTHGIVLFISSKKFNYYYVPKELGDDIVSIGSSFDLSPLQDVVNQNKSYYVLAISHKNTCLYEGDQYNLTKLNLPNFPTNMKKTLNIDEYQKFRETHTVASPSLGKGSEAFHHGQYNVSQTDKEMLLKFFQKIDRYLHNFLQKIKSI